MSWMQRRLCIQLIKPCAGKGSTRRRSDGCVEVLMTLLQFTVYSLGLTVSQAVRLIGLLLIYASQKIIH